MSSSSTLKEIFENIRETETNLKDQQTELEKSKDDVLNEMLKLIVHMEENYEKVRDRNNELLIENEKLRIRIRTLEKMIQAPCTVKLTRNTSCTPSPKRRIIDDANAETPDNIVITEHEQRKISTAKKSLFNPSLRRVS